MLLKGNINHTVFGITGGIGSGKSVVSHILRIMGYPVYDSDSNAKSLMNSSDEIRSALIARFGREVYTTLGLNRKYLAAKIFADADSLSFVNSVVHPAVGRHFLEWTKSQSSEFVFIESAILFSSGLDKLVDHSVYVDAPSDVRLSRAVLRDGTSKDAVESRMSKQHFDELYAKQHSDFCIFNDSLTLLVPQVLSIINKF